MAEKILLGSLILWGLLLFSIRAGNLLRGDYAHRLEYSLRASIRPPFSLLCILALAWCNTLLLAYYVFAVGGSMFVAAVSLVGLFGLVLLWVSLDWASWREGWLESMIEQPHIFWSRLDRIQWGALALGIGLWAWSLYVLRELLLNSRAV
ncbi:MAG: hypothetical protein QM518_04655 [Verrucomicrobiota bacterium]|nr:hypothetical protein [Verrucomicrobiota bacterium]